MGGLDLELSDGLWKGNAELVARFMTADGVQAGDVFAQSLTFNLRPETYTSALEKGIAHHEELPLPEKAVVLKLLVGSLASGKTGTLTIPLSEVHAK